MEFLNDFYRTRLYAPLLAFFIFLLFSPSAKKAVYGIKSRIDSLPTWKVALFMGLISFTFCALCIYPGKSWGGDFSQYFAQARAIATGTVSDWYDRNQFIINTSCDGVGADVYPWLWAVCIAPIYALFSYFPYTLLKIIECLAVAGTTSTLVYLYKRRMSLSSAMFLSGFTAWNIGFILSVNTVEADLICLFFVIETINIVDIYNSKCGTKHYVLWAFLTGLFLYLSVQTKTMAKAALLALICYDILLILKPLMKSLGTVLGDWSLVRLIPIITYYILTKVTDLILPAAGGTYNDYFTVSLWRIKFGIHQYFWAFSSFFGGADREVITYITAALTVLVIVFGIWGAIVSFKQNGYMIIYTCGMMAMLLIYNYYRLGFIYSLFPTMILFAYIGVRRLSKIKYCTFAAGVTVLLMTFLAAVFVVINVRFYGYNNNDIETPQTQEMFAYVRENLSKEDVVFFFKPRVLYYYTDVSSYTWRDDDPDKLADADYVLVDIWNEQPKIQAVLENTDEYELQWDNECYFLYKKVEK